MRLIKLLFLFNILLFLTLFGMAQAEEITIDQMHVYFVTGLNEGEQNKRSSIEKLKNKVEHAKTHGVDEIATRVRFAESKAHEKSIETKPKSKAALAKEARDKTKKDKRETLAFEKENTIAIADLTSQIKKLNNEPANWVKPSLSVKTDEIGTIGMLVYPEGAFTQPDVSYQVPSGSQERGSAAEVMSRYIDSLRTDVSGVKIKFTIISILDESSAIATDGNSTICLSGIATHNFVDDQIVEVAKPVIIDSPTRYTTIARSTKSVKTLRQLSDSEVKKLNAYIADQIAASQSASAPAESAESK